MNAKRIGYQVEVVDVTPQLAAEWLIGQGTNRSLRRGGVDSYAHVMRNGGWKLSPQGIIFDMSGRLRDGQHRLSAVVQTGCTVQMYVFRNVPEEIIPILDLGKNRTAADSILMESGDKFAAKKAAIANAMVGIERGGGARMSPLLCKKIIANIGEEHVDTVCEYSRAKFPAVAQATFAYVRPISPDMVDELADKLIRRETFAGLEASMLRALGDTSRLKNRHSETGFKLLRGLQAYVTDMRLEKIQMTEQGLEWAQQQRKLIGFATLVVPDDYRPGRW